VAKYAKKDVELAFKLWQWQEKEIKKQDLENVWALEKKLFPVIVDMERKGVRIDVKKANDAVNTLSIKIQKLTNKLHGLAGFECNFNPSGDIVKLFSPKLNANGDWELRDGTLCEKTPLGKPSINSEVLKRMSDPCASVILSLRKLTKTRDTFLNGHIISNLNEGYIHANINQVVNEARGITEGTKTGRFSMSRPALQQIPARDKDISSILRPLFIPDPGEVWLSIDYRQFEFRIFAHYVKNDEIIKLFHENPDIDFHQLVADIANIPRNAKESGGPNAKQVNLGMVMGMGAGKMAKEMRMPYTVEKIKKNDGSIKERIIPGEAALDVLNKYHKAIPGVREMQNSATARAEGRGYVFTLAKRRIHYPNKNQCYKAASNIYQGGAADCLKQKLIEVHALLKKEGRGRILLSVHDEINLSVPDDKALIDKIVTCMETFDGIECPIKLRVPIRTDPGTGNHWGSASGK
jgi:DNA polymerase-1